MTVSCTNHSGEDQYNPALRELLGSDIDTDRFFRLYWEQRPLLIEKPSWPQNLLNISTIEHLIAFRHPGKTVSMVKTVFECSSNRAKFESQSSTNPNAIVQAWYDGATVIISQIHHHDAQVALYVQELTSTFQHEIGANLYFTPPNSQGFQAHVDDHDVFVLQLEGRKEWIIHSSNHATDSNSEKESFPIDLTLQRGQALYIPSGYPHSARSLDEPSIHLTIGLYPFKVNELIGRAIDRFAQDHPELPSSVPPGSKLDIEWARKLPCVEPLLEGCYLNNAFKELRRDFLYRSRPVISRRFGERPSSIELDTYVRSRFHGLALVETKDGRSAIYFPGNFVSGPEVLAPAMEYASERAQWTPRELPGGLSDQTKLVLARRLAHEGYITTVYED